MSAPDSLAAALLPSNSTPLERAIATTDDRILTIDADVVRRVTLPDECPEDQLHILAWEYSVDEWDPSWPVARKREVIKSSYDIHRHKGTAYALDIAIGALGYGAVVEEWFEYGGHPYRFRLSIDLDDLGDFSRERTEQLIRTALRAKNVRSYLEYVRFKRTTTGSVFVGVAVHSRVTQTVGPFIPTSIEARPYLYAGAHVVVRNVTTIYPRTI